MATLTSTLTSTNLPGVPITVSVVIAQTNPLVFQITASVNSVAYTEVHTIGADGAGPLMTAAGLQQNLNSLRQAVADKAAWQASTKGLVSSLV